MYLQDFQRMGGIFIPDKVLKKTFKKVLMRGALILHGDTYYIHICVRSKKLTRITRVCGQTLKETISSKKRLLDVFSNAVTDNTFGMREIMLSRRSRFFQWVFCLVLNFISLLFACYLTKKTSGDIIYLMILLCNIGALIYGFSHKESMVVSSLNES